MYHQQHLVFHATMIPACSRFLHFIHAWNFSCCVNASIWFALGHWGLTTYIWVSELGYYWFKMAWSLLTAIYHMNECWRTVNWISRNEIKLNLNHNTIFQSRKIFEKVVYKIWAILFFQILYLNEWCLRIWRSIKPLKDVGWIKLHVTILNILKPKQNVFHFADNISKWNVLEKTV